MGSNYNEMRIKEFVNPTLDLWYVRMLFLSLYLIQSIFFIDAVRKYSVEVVNKQYMKRDLHE